MNAVPAPKPSPPKKSPAIVKKRPQLSDDQVALFGNEFRQLTGFSSAPGTTEERKQRVYSAFVRESNGKTIYRFPHGNYPEWLVEAWAYLYIDTSVDAITWRDRLKRCGFPYDEGHNWPDFLYFMSIDHARRLRMSENK